MAFYLCFSTYMVWLLGGGCGFVFDLLDFFSNLAVAPEKNAAIPLNKFVNIWMFLCPLTQGLLREDRGSKQVELFSANFTSKSAAKINYLVSFSVLS